MITKEQNDKLHELCKAAFSRCHQSGVYFANAQRETGLIMSNDTAEESFNCDLVCIKVSKYIDSLTETEQKPVK